MRRSGRDCFRSSPVVSPWRRRPLAAQRAQTLGARAAGGRYAPVRRKNRAAFVGSVSSHLHHDDRPHGPWRRSATALPLRRAVAPAAHGGGSADHRECDAETLSPPPPAAGIRGWWGGGWGEGACAGSGRRRCWSPLAVSVRGFWRGERERDGLTGRDGAPEGSANRAHEGSRRGCVDRLIHQRRTGAVESPFVGWVASAAHEPSVW